ncbi:hypothetical protein BUALT_Bualt09G0068200 [Buddleja alternifolia]|uniref:Nuclear factor related to kappa-B-binding protein second winged helix domain-containing protein n=1 Tax=Buddleja alternifolia TaxID=168488 RepID=A0AAV6X1S7_9LAMI|nr:hypothetical protein BUALT_Bualt09G0068200 [Buddleja alternifolia]
MLNLEACTILESTKKMSDEVFDQEELNAAEVLYEMANAQCSSPAYTNDKKAEKKHKKREFVENGSSSRSHKKNERFRAIHETSDQYDRAVQGLCNLHNVDAQKLPSELSFSVTHLLSAVRSALITPLPGHVVNKEVIKKNLSFLNIDQIVRRVRLNPGDPLILECEDPLVELVKGVLNIFSSEMGPVGAIRCKPLTVYDKSRKSWRWTGPLPDSLSQNCNKVGISHISWGISQENLIKLVNQFYIWWTIAQLTLRLIASLPEPPLELMQVRDFQTRFNDRKKLNQCTIGQRCDEVRAYFQREEAIRYSVPDKGFLYTTLDGKKSAAAPLRKRSSTTNNKTFAKSRGHYIFKSERPPYFSLLSLVRDAAARLPHGMGTRADICSLIRDSQFIVDDIPEKTVKQLVSGALDRLQSELDPCVEYIGQWGLWVYLHKDRDEEDFVENGTSSVRMKRFIVDDIPEKTVKQLVSGALDRLQSELDPCVEYIGQWGLWIYLHKDRDAEDFVENGTSSVRTKRIKISHAN